MSRMMAAGHAAIAAATLHSGSGDMEAFKATFKTMLAGILANGETQPGDAVAQAQVNLAQGGVAAPPAVDFENDEARWRDALVDNPQNWYNNVRDAKATSGGGKGPDFRHKADKDQGVFLYGKFPAPAWVYEKLGLAPHASLAPQPTVPTTIPSGEVPF